MHKGTVTNCDGSFGTAYLYELAVPRYFPCNDVESRGNLLATGYGMHPLRDGLSSFGLDTLRFLH